MDLIRMNEKYQKVVTVDDFNVICRVCLEIGQDMVDIFKSGIKNQLMEVTRLKVEPNDKLPNSLCQKCSIQINQLFLLLEQAKSSDFYLRSLLSSSELSADLKDHSKATRNISIKKKTYRKRIKKWEKKSTIMKNIKNDLENDKMYLIFVPETNGAETKIENEIYIKDVTFGNGNLELSNYCRNLMKSHFSDHTYPKEEKNSYDKDNNELFKSNCCTDLKCERNKTFAVNLQIFECSECKETYEELKDLIAHFSTHKVNPNFETSNLSGNFNCPVCNIVIEEKTNFLDHLKRHREDGFFFVKVNSAGNILPVKELEKEIFSESYPKHTVNCKIFNLSLNSLNCTICSENLQSIDCFNDHLESCLSRDKSNIKYHLSYTCPVCCRMFVDEEKNFIQHLATHKAENCYFIKVDPTGKPVEVAEDEKLFVPFEEAVKINCSKSTIFEIVDTNSCDKCDYSSEIFSDICEHKELMHSEKMSSETLFCCPVCQKELGCCGAPENQTEFYEHLKIHKNEGVSFILVKKNGGVSEKKYCDIFTQSLFLWSIINSSHIIFENISPELIIADQTDSSTKYTCDLCQENFKSKHEIIIHLKTHQTLDAAQDYVNYMCEKCGKKFSGKANYKKHFLKHSKVLSSICRRPMCTICNKKFANRATLNGHMKNHLKEENGNQFQNSSFEIICEKCGKSFSNNASLTKHKKMHLKEKENTVLKCEICDRDFFRQSSFERHKSAHLNPKYFECSICKLPLPSISSLQKHSEIHKNGSNTFDCKACQLSFLTKDSLTAHQTHTGHYLDRKPLECNVCHEKFFIGRKFSEHIKTHPKYKMGECTLCGKRLSTTQSLMLHMGRHFESNCILCPHCGKQFFEERNYHRHLLTHEGIKPYSCDMEACKKSFYTLFELNRHKKYHSNTRDFRCLYCSKSFHEANHLTVHIRTHTGERPYTCPHCNKGFVTRTHCKHHIKLVHQGVGYDLIRSNISKKVTVFEAVEA